MRLPLLAAVLLASPAAAGDWQEMSAGQLIYAAGDWMAICDTGEPYGCTASVEAGDDAGGPGRVLVLWAEGGDEGFGMTVEADRTPSPLPETITVSVDGDAEVLRNSADFFPVIEGAETGAAEIGEPLLLVDLTERMAAGSEMVWDWDAGRKTVPLAGFAEVFAAVEARRQEQF